MLIELKRCNSVGNINGMLFLISIIAGKDKISRDEIRNRCALENDVTVNCPGAVAFLEYLRLVETDSDTVRPTDKLNSTISIGGDEIINRLVTLSINRLIEDGIFDNDATGFDADKGRLTIKQYAFIKTTGSLSWVSARKGLRWNNFLNDKKIRVKEGWKPKSLYCIWKSNDFQKRHQESSVSLILMLPQGMM